MECAQCKQSFEQDYSGGRGYCLRCHSSHMFEAHRPRTFSEVLRMRREHEATLKEEGRATMYIDLALESLIGDSFKNLNKIAVLEEALRTRGHPGRLVFVGHMGSGTVLKGDEPEYAWLDEVR